MRSKVFIGVEPAVEGSIRFLFQVCCSCHRSLNRIQSRIYQKAFTSNENLLVCAPTGAGKTNIAMIAVLREVGANMRQGVIQKHDFKIVYVAPMKALAAEVTATFSRRLSALGERCCCSKCPVRLGLIPGCRTLTLQALKGADHCQDVECFMRLRKLRAATD